MYFNDLLKLVGDDPVFSSSFLLAGDVDPKAIRLQLSRWVKSGRIIQLRRGIYCIAPPYQKMQPHPFVVANRLQRASYVSLESALAYYGMIPETVNIITSVSTGRPERLQTPLGTFDYRHIKTDLLFGYQFIKLETQNAFVAAPEKALLDLIYLHPGAETFAYLTELRLQNLEQLNIAQLDAMASRFDSHKIQKAIREIKILIKEDRNGYEDL